MDKSWLWDRKISTRKLRSIFKNESHSRFAELAGLLLARKNTPKEVFKDYFSTLVFCRNWQRIKKRMRQDSWSDPRIEYWQAIYEKLTEKYRQQNITIRSVKPASYPANELSWDIANKIIAARRQKGLTQADLAKKSGVSQQMISRIEKGQQNISVSTLKKLADSLGCQVAVELIGR